MSQISFIDDDLWALNGHCVIIHYGQLFFHFITCHIRHLPKTIFAVKSACFFNLKWHATPAAKRTFPSLRQQKTFSPLNGTEEEFFWRRCKMNFKNFCFVCSSSYCKKRFLIKTCFSLVVSVIKQILLRAIYTLKVTVEYQAGKTKIRQRNFEKSFEFHLTFCVAVTTVNPTTRHEFNSFLSVNEITR